MDISTLISHVKTLSARDDIDNVTALLFINQVKLELNRDYSFRMFQNTIFFGTQINRRGYDLPSDFFAPITLRRQQLDKIVSDPNLGNVVQKQRFRLWLDKGEFQSAFPELDELGKLVTGTPNNFNIFGDRFDIAPAPVTAETLFFDYKRKLPDYNLVTITTDEISAKSWDVLVFGALQLVFEAWTPDEKKALTWMNRKNKSISSMRRNEAHASAATAIDDLQMETFDGRWGRRSN